MLPSSFGKLFGLLESGLTKQFVIREPISAKERLVVTLYFLGQDVSLGVLSHNFRIGRSTLSNIVAETCQLIWDTLESVIINLPTSERGWTVVADRYLEKWQFPNCIGALDGKHCRIQAPPHTGALDYNFHQYFSLNLTALCDADYRFLFVDVGSYGHNNDVGVLDTSLLGINFANDRYALPPPSLLPGSQARVPYFMVGDDIYPLKSYLMKPFPGRGLTKEQRIFNGRLSRARRCIENCLGILTGKWRLLRIPIIATRDNACRYIRAICCLHNFCRMKSDAAYCSGVESVNTAGELSNESRLQQMPEQRARNANNATKSGRASASIAV